MDEGHPWPTSPTDDDAQHMQVHAQNMQQMGDPKGVKAQHVAMHRMQQITKALAQAQMQMQQGGGPSGPQGAPRSGAQPAAPRQGKGPPGQIAPDQMSKAGAMVPPRRA